MNDSVSRQAAIDAANNLIDRIEKILRDIRETKEDDSVCGMCEYDGAYIGQSGDWCNECPRFDKSDCFRLSDRCRKRWVDDIALPSAQPEPVRIISETRAIPSDDDHVSLSEMVTATYYDEENEEWSQKSVTVRDVLDSVCDDYTILPSAQLEVIRCKDCVHRKGKSWVSCELHGWVVEGDDYCSFAERKIQRQARNGLA